MSRVARLQRRRRSRRPTNLHRALHVGENFTKRRRRALVRFRVETNRPTSDEVAEKGKNVLAIKILNQNLKKSTF